MTKLNPETDLVLERVVDVPPERVWKAWTTPEQILKWFTPAPWKTVECQLDLRPGGRFHTVMQSPEGERFPNDGCYLEVVENRRLTWTSVLGADYRPIKSGAEGIDFTATVTMEPHGSGGTKYTAIARHPDAATARKHADMGFQDGWGAALDQLVAMIKAT